VKSDHIAVAPYLRWIFDKANSRWLIFRAYERRYDGWENDFATSPCQRYWNSLWNQSAYRFPSGVEKTILGWLIALHFPGRIRNEDDTRLWKNHCSILFFVCGLSQRGESASMKSIPAMIPLPAKHAKHSSTRSMKKQVRRWKRRCRRRLDFMGKDGLKSSIMNAKISAFYEILTVHGCIRMGRQRGTSSSGDVREYRQQCHPQFQIGFQIRFPEIIFNDPADTGKADSGLGFVPALNRHDKSNDAAYIHDDMKAKSPADGCISFIVRFGGLQWIEASPLTLWKSKAGFSPGISSFWKRRADCDVLWQNLEKVERTGRSAWNKKPFYGLGLECKNCRSTFISTCFTAFTNAMTAARGNSSIIQATLIIPTRRRRKTAASAIVTIMCFHFRLAKANIFDNLIVGFNYMGYHVQKTLVIARPFKKPFSGPIPMTPFIAIPHFIKNLKSHPSISREQSISDWKCMPTSQWA